MSIEHNIRKLQKELIIYPEAHLIAVGKTFPATSIIEAARCGITHIGENYLQEAEEKQAACKHYSLTWHFLGAIQRNKTDKIAALFDWVHGIDRVIIAKRLSQARKDSPKPLNCFLQINIDNEPSKFGVGAIDAIAIAGDISTLAHINLCGLMAIPSPKDNQYDTFCKVTQLQHEIIASGVKLDSLSMGMSNDYSQALKAGATHIRIGTGIFGMRSKKG